MAELTTGYVAGVIAFAIVVAQLWFPNAIIFVLAGQLKDRETAATWTIASRFLQSSLWPPLLQADSSKTVGVRRTVSWMTLSVPLIAILISVAGVVTPLGLYEVDEPANAHEWASFEYVKDSSPFALGTSPRKGASFTRTCSMLAGCFVPCPYTTDVLIFSTDGLSSNCSTPYETNATVPQIVNDIYMSGTKKRKTTISNYFDIEWRQLTTEYRRIINNGTPIDKGSFRFLESIVLNDKLHAVEGLVVDGKKGGIGMRNHTIPVGHSRGVTWSEDLLFIEPEVECVDTNVTIDFMASTGNEGSIGLALNQFRMIDRGGFVNINKTAPLDEQRNGRNAPDLKMRAYQAAYFANGYHMLYWNLTDPSDEGTGTKVFDRLDSEMNKEFKLPKIDSWSTGDYKSLHIIPNFGFHVGLLVGNTTGSETSANANPHNITAYDFDFAKNLCQGTSPNTPARLNETFVVCNLIRGVPRRMDDGPSHMFENGSSWSAPLYGCASTVKATVKKVTMFHNGTSDSLDNLVVQKVEDKVYENDDDMPFWGMEDWASSLNLTQFQPVWGILDPSFETVPNVSTIRAPSLYMVGSGSDINQAKLNSLSLMNNIPASIFPAAALNTVSTLQTLSTSSYDFLGENSLSLWLKWAELSKSVDTVGDTIKLMWTDLAASAVVGTKGALGSYNQESDQAARIRVLPTVHRVKYRWAFGIPAFIVALILAIIALVVLVSTVTGQSSLAVMRQRLKHVALGRALTTIFYANTSNYRMTPGEWSRANGEKEVDVTSGHPMPVTRADAPMVVNNPVPVPQQYAAVPQQPPVQQVSHQEYVQQPQQWRGVPDAISPQDANGVTYFPERKS